MEILGGKSHVKCYFSNKCFHELRVRPETQSQMTSSAFVLHNANRSLQADCIDVVICILGACQKKENRQICCEFSQSIIHCPFEAAVMRKYIVIHYRYKFRA